MSGDDWTRESGRADDGQSSSRRRGAGPLRATPLPLVPERCELFVNGVGSTPGFGRILSGRQYTGPPRDRPFGPPTGSIVQPRARRS